LKIRILLYIFTLLFASIFTIHLEGASHWYFYKINTENGLSQNSVTCILKDRDGFLWFGTYNGLNRYDGYNFIVYKSAPEGPLSNNVIRSLLEDDKGNIWIATENGVNRFDKKTNTFKVFNNDSKSAGSLSNNFVQTLFKDSKGKLWLGTKGGGLNLFNPENDSFESFMQMGSSEQIYSLNYIYSITEDTIRNCLNIGTEHGLFFFSPTTKVFEPASLNNSELYNVSILTQKRLGDKLYFGTWGRGMYLYDIQSRRINSLYAGNSSSFNSRVVTSIVIENGSMWLGTRDGLIYIDKNKNQSRFHARSQSSHPIASNTILSLYHSKDGIIWIGTDLGGVNKLLLNNKNFDYLQMSQESGLNDISVKSFSADKKSKFWMGTKNEGLIQYDLSLNSIVTRLQDDVNYPIQALYISRDGDLWYGSDGGGLTHFNHSKQKKQNFRYEIDCNNCLGNNYVYAIAADHTGCIWIGTYGAYSGGLDRYDPVMKKFDNFSLVPGNPLSVQSREILSLLVDKQGSLWIGTKGFGLYKLLLDKNPYPIPQTSVFRQYDKNRGKIYSLSDDNIYSLYQAKNGLIYIGTGGGGLNRLNPATDSVEVFNTPAGLNNDMVYSISEDGFGNIWLATGTGISKFDVSSKTFRNYNERDGMFNVGFAQNGVIALNDKLMFAGLNGITQFNPSSLKENTSHPDIKIVDLKIYNTIIKPVSYYRDRMILNKEISNTDTLRLSHVDRYFTLEFSTLNYQSPDKSRYQYRLDGLDAKDEWITTSAERRFATYMNLNPGKYLFRVKGTNSEGIWSKERHLYIHISPPFYRTIWFYVILVILIFVGLEVLFKWRQKTMIRNMSMLEEKVMERTSEIQEQKEEIEKQKNELEKINQTKNKFFSIIAHDLKNPFHAILNFSDILNKDYQSLSEAERIEIAQLIHQSADNTFNLLENLLQWSRSQTGRIMFNPEKLDLVKLVNTTYELLRHMAENKKITLALNTQSSVSVFGDKNMLLTVIRNLVNNAIKFTPENGRIDVFVTSELTHAKITIRDSGIGIRKEVLDRLFDLEQLQSTSGTSGETGTGLGLVLCKEFIERNKGTISVSSKVAQGSVFTILLPLIN